MVDTDILLNTLYLTKSTDRLLGLLAKTLEISKDELIRKLVHRSISRVQDEEIPQLTADMLRERLDLTEEHLENSGV